MAEFTKDGQAFVQIGVTAMRDRATGKFLPSRPLYIKVDANEIDSQTGLYHGEQELINDVAGVFADKMKKYITETKRMNKKRK